jgi:hypothetical protein
MPLGLVFVCLGGFFLVARMPAKLNRHRARGAADGFTLIDFLVTFAIGAIVVAITITVIQMVVSR